MSVARAALSRPRRQSHATLDGVFPRINSEQQRGSRDWTLSILWLGFQRIALDWTGLRAVRTGVLGMPPPTTAPTRVPSAVTADPQGPGRRPDTGETRHGTLGLPLALRPGSSRARWWRRGGLSAGGRTSQGPPLLLATLSLPPTWRLDP